jgi:uncharacterized protein
MAGRRDQGRVRPPGLSRPASEPEREPEREPEPVTPEPPRDVGRTVFTQTWAELGLLHWAVEPERVRPHLPPGTRPDVLDGVTYVGLVPFRMRGIGAWGGPALPYVGSFLETNVRLYSVDRQGRRGVVFLSLDASRLAPVLAARWGPGLPYLWSAMRLRRAGDVVEYRCRRRWPGPRGASSLIRLQVGAEIEAGPREHFLTARWGLHQPRRTGWGRGRPATAYWPNAHERWPLHSARLEHLDDGLLAAAGFGDLAGRVPDSVLYSPGVHAVFGPRRPA